MISGLGRIRERRHGLEPSSGLTSSVELRPACFSMRPASRGTGAAYRRTHGVHESSSVHAS